MKGNTWITHNFLCQSEIGHRFFFTFNFIIFLLIISLYYKFKPNSLNSSMINILNLVKTLKSKKTPRIRDYPLTKHKKQHMIGCNGGIIIIKRKKNQYCNPQWSRDCAEFNPLQCSSFSSLLDLDFFSFNFFFLIN